MAKLRALLGSRGFPESEDLDTANVDQGEGRQGQVCREPHPRSLVGETSFLLDGMEATIPLHEANGLRFSITEAEREEASQWFTVRKGLRQAIPGEARRHLQRLSRSLLVVPALCL